MRENIPDLYKTEAQLLESEGYITLLELTLLSPAVMAGNGGSQLTLRFSSLNAVTWQTDMYEAIPFSITGVGANSSGEVIRPKLSLPNAAGAFSTYAHQGWLDNASVIRRIIRKADLDNDINSFMQKQWRISKIVNLSKNTITAELRSVFDGHNFKMPPRSYFPPEFPSVSLR
jgi:phage-related protein